MASIFAPVLLLSMSLVCKMNCGVNGPSDEKEIDKVSIVNVSLDNHEAQSHIVESSNAMSYINPELSITKASSHHQE